MSATQPLTYGAIPVTYERQQLDNGLQLVASQLRDTRAASVRVFLGGGSRAEPDNVAGVAHFLEHAVFKGTENWPTSAISAGLFDLRAITINRRKSLALASNRFAT